MGILFIAISFLFSDLATLGPPVNMSKEVRDKISIPPAIWNSNPSLTMYTKYIGILKINTSQIIIFVIDGMHSPVLTRERCSIHFDGCLIDSNSPLKELLR